MLNSEVGSLRKHGQPVVLSPSALSVLACLLQSEGRAATRKALFHAGWPGTRVTDGSLTQAIWELRRALQDSSCADAIQTVRGVGYRFVSAQLAPSAPSTAEAKPTSPLFGRQVELQRLRTAMQAAGQGAGRTCLVTGPAAIGKTRLCSELVEEARRAGWTLLSANALPQNANSPACWPWLQMLGRYFGADGDSRSSLLLEQAPRVKRLLSSRGSEPAEISPAESPASNAYLHEELTRLFVQLSSAGPCLFWLDDLHWADGASLALLPLLSHALQRTSALLLIASRSPHGPELGQALAELSREHPNERIDLRGLALHEVRDVLEHECADSAAAHEVTALTSGNPLLTREVARLLARASLSALPSQPAERHELSTLLKGRLAELSPDVQRLLQAASVVGTMFRASDLAALAELAPEQVLAGLEQLEHESYVRELEAPSGRFSFVHAALRDAAYAGLSRAQRLLLHQRAAERIERLGLDHIDERLRELAEHYGQAAEGGCAERALHYALRAAKRAWDEGSHTEAASYYRSALSAHDLSPTQKPEQRLQVLLALGEAAAAAGQPVSEVRALFREAATRAAALGLHELFARAALGHVGQHAIGFMPMRTDGTVEPDEIALLEQALARAESVSVEYRALLMASLAFSLACTTQRVRRERLLCEALSMARAVGSPWLLSRILLAKIYACTAPDQLDELKASCDELVQLAERLESRSLALTARLLRMMCALQRADIRVARADSAVALRYAEQLGPADKQRAAVLEVLSAFWEGRMDDAQRLSQAIYQVSQHDPNQCILFGLRMGRVLAANYGVNESALKKARGTASTYANNEGWLTAVTWVAAVTGAADVAREHFDLAARDGFANLPQEHSWLACMQLLGEAAVHLHDPARARIIYEQLLPYADRLVFQGWCAIPWGSVAVTLGRISSLLGRHDEAQRLFNDARAKYSALGASLFLAVLDLAEAQALLRQHRADGRERALSLLARARRFAETRKICWLRQQIDDVQAHPPALDHGRPDVKPNAQA